MGTAQAKTVVLPNNANKEKLQYEASLSCSSTNHAYVSDKTNKQLPPEQQAYCIQVIHIFTYHLMHRMKKWTQLENI